MGTKEKRFAMTQPPTNPTPDEMKTPIESERVNAARLVLTVCADPLNKACEIITQLEQELQQAREELDRYKAETDRLQAILVQRNYTAKAFDDLQSQLSQWQECARELLEMAKWGIANEQLAGNIVKEEFWKGQKSAITQLTSTTTGEKE